MSSCLNKKLLTICFFFLLIYSVLLARVEETASFLKAGQLAFLRGDYNAAEIEFSNILLIDPENFEGRIWLAKVYLAQKNLTGASKLLSEASKQAPAHFMIVKLQDELRAEETDESLSGIDPMMEERLSLLKNDIPVRRYGLVIPEQNIHIPREETKDVQSLLAILNDTYEETSPIESIDNEILLDKPSDFQNHFSISKRESGNPLEKVFATLESKGMNAALDLYVEMAINDPKTGTYSDRGFLQRASALYQQRMRANPYDLEAQYYCAAAKYFDGLHDDAGKIIKMLNQRPYEPRKKEIDYISNKLESYFRSIASYNRQQEQSRSAAEAKKASEAKAAAKPDGQEKFWKKLEEKRRLEINEQTTKESQFLHDDGFKLYKQGRLDEAIKKYRQALEISPNNPEFNYHLGLALSDKALSGETVYFTQALEAFNRAALADPSSKYAKDAKKMANNIEEMQAILEDPHGEKYDSDF